MVCDASAGAGAGAVDMAVIFVPMLGASGGKEDFLSWLGPARDFCEEVLVVAELFCPGTNGRKSISAIMAATSSAKAEVGRDRCSSPAAEDLSPAPREFDEVVKSRLEPLDGDESDWLDDGLLRDPIDVWDRVNDNDATEDGEQDDADEGEEEAQDELEYEATILGL